MPRRAKIVCTLGPATASAERIHELVAAGMDVARLNCSHGKHSDHEASYRMVRAAANQVGRSVAILADLQGPKIRLGGFAGGPVEWSTGEIVRVTTEDCPGSHDRVSTTYAGLARDVRVDDRLLVDDGKVALTVIEVQGSDVECLVVEGGPVSDHKGLSLPNGAVSVPAPADKDIEDLRFALGLSVDMVALSFVRSPEDITLVHAIMAEVGVRVPVIAKLEKPEAVANLAAIIDAFDGVMVVRGDLGVELPLEQVPLVQKRAVQMCRERAKPVIVATQMLESMIEASRPTRAEASDVANAVLDGADALMLSGETSVGRHPVQVVRTMESIIAAVEEDTASHVRRWRTCRGPRAASSPRLRGGSASAWRPRRCAASRRAATPSGGWPASTPRCRCSHSPPSSACAASCPWCWGVETFLTPRVQTTDEMVAQVQDILLGLSGFARGDHVVITAGTPPGTPGSTNALRVWRLGDEIPHA